MYENAQMQVVAEAKFENKISEQLQQEIMMIKRFMKQHDFDL